MSTLTKSLGTLFPAMRLSLALVLLTTCILLSSEMLGFTPNEDKYLLDARAKISESLAIQFSVLVPDQDIKKIQKLIRYIVKRNPDILTAGIRMASGRLIYQSNNHDELWEAHDEKNSTSSHVIVPVYQNKNLWGNVELRFEELKSDSLLGFFKKPIFKMAAFILLSGFFVYLAFMLRTLRQLDPSSVIPERVNAAFDALSESVIIVDEQEQILLTNKAFGKKIGRSPESLIGVKASELNWQRITLQKSGAEYPWIEVLKHGKATVGAQLMLKLDDDEPIKFAINASPIIGDSEKVQGVLVTLDDITEIEQRNTDLETMVVRLEKTKGQVQQQNKELHYLATRDPLTGCLNRRSFSDQFEGLFNTAREQGAELCCFMVDLDHFKLVNDNYGHATGDLVIKLLAEILESNTRQEDLVGRYGGEEFCVVLPGQSIDIAITIAERIRLRMKDESINRFEDGPSVTASIGVASIFDEPASSDELNNLADEALYVAKESGRNKVARWQPASEIVQTVENEKDEIPENPQPVPTDAEITNLHIRINELEGIASKFSQELEYANSYDPLTGLPNQILFHDRINQAIERGLRHDQIAAVLVVDIEMFSQVNATLGRAVGDLLLQEVATRLNTTFRKSDGISRLTVSRFAGDEFTVLLTELSHEEEATWAVKRLLDVINKPANIGGNTIYLSCHVGVSLYTADANTVEELLNNAMTAKQYCKNHKSELNYQFYDQHIQDLSIKHLQLDKDLRHSVEHKHWQLFYQAKQDVKEGKIIGAEALIRWNHPQRGLLSPFEFIDFAEQHGHIVSIGDWVINEACMQIKQWSDEGIQDCRIAINLSSVQLVQPDIVEKILLTLAKYKVPPRLFEVEITETILMNNIQAAMESLQRLHSRGIKIAIDDFGTGYSSLSYLKNLPIDRLKIDRTFIKDINNDDNDKKIVQTLISMAHSLDISVVAEGVEEQAQFDLLDRYSCDEIQGYLLSKPVPADQFAQLIKNPRSPINATEKILVNS
jgi:diguanylate cyclase (GGDEF)-like protein/PAS domain S-box-containing protein